MNCLRFHVSSGPASLFERVRFKFSEPRVLRLHAKHFLDRATERAAPVDVLEHFDPRKWELVTVEARADSGKFVSTGWRRVIDGRTWWLIIGLHDTVQTVFRGDRKTGRGPRVTTAGPDYELVDWVNRSLMEQDRAAQNC